MTRARCSMLLLALVALLAGAIAASPAQAAKRKVPFGFFGAVVPPELSQGRTVSDATLDGQLSLMARSGVESVRITYLWEWLEPTQGAYTLDRVDRVVGAAARHGISVVLNVTQTPKWATSRPSSPEFGRYPPRDLSSMAPLWSTLATRYGPSGSYWAENPTVPRQPVRRWQVWNEQSAPWHWAKRPPGPTYTRLLKASYQAIKAVDRRATVIAGSVVASPGYSQWAAVRGMYRAGAKRWFDEISVHPFTNNRRSAVVTINQMLDIVGRVRKETRKARDGRVPIILTELTWPASVGRVPRAALLGLETNKAGQVKRMKLAYRKLAQQRRRLGVTQAYWFNWATQYDAKGSVSVMTFRYSGLTRLRGTAFTPMPILRTFSSLARKYEGCRKSTHARRCR